MDNLPEEVLRQILLCLPPRDILGFCTIKKCFLNKGEDFWESAAQLNYPAVQPWETWK